MVEGALSTMHRMFVHLRLHTEFSVVDGTNRIDEVVKAAAADRQPALAITDLNNLFGAIKFYKAGARQGRQAHHRRRSVRSKGWAQRPARSRASSLLVQNRQGYLQPVRTAGARLDAERGRGQAQAVCKLAWLEELQRRA